MADQLYFSRDSKCFIEFNNVFWDIPVLDGFSFSQGNESTEITLAEMESTGGTSRRGRRAFNTALSAGEWSLSTYVRPFTSAGSGDGAADAAAEVHAVEEVLWAMMVGADQYDGSTNYNFTRGSSQDDKVNTAATATNTFDFSESNRSTLGTANIYFVLGDTNRTVMQLKDAVVNEASIDFDIDGIATINWSGNCSEVNDITGSTIEDAAADLVLVGQVNDSDNIPSGETAVVLDSVTGLTVGDEVFGAAGIAASTKISAINTATKTVTLDTATTAIINDDTQLHFRKQTRDDTSIVDDDFLIDTADSNRLKRIVNLSQTFLNGAVSIGDTKIVVDSLTGVEVGDLIIGGGFPAGTTVSVIDPDDDNANEFTASAAATAAASDNAPISFEKFSSQVYEKTTATDNFIRNRLTQLSVTVSDQDQDNDGTNDFASTYALTLTGGNITFSNNVTYITPEELGKVNTPFAHVTGTRTIGGSFTCYLTLDTDTLDGTGTKSRDLFDDLRNASTVVTNSMDLTFKIGGTTGTRLEVNFPTAHLEIPSHSVEDVISLETNFMALPSTIDGTDEATIKYAV